MNENLDLSRMNSEFPDYVLNVQVPPGFVDASWHNDECPCFQNKSLDLILYIGEADIKDRAREGAVRFSLQETIAGMYPADTRSEHMLDTNSMEDVLARIEVVKSERAAISEYADVLTMAFAGVVQYDAGLDPEFDLSGYDRLDVIREEISLSMLRSLRFANQVQLGDNLASMISNPTLGITFTPPTSDENAAALAGEVFCAGVKYGLDEQSSAYANHFVRVATDEALKLIQYQREQTVALNTAPSA